jgi:hypothetical protein
MKLARLLLAALALSSAAACSSEITAPGAKSPSTSARAQLSPGATSSWGGLGGSGN